MKRFFAILILLAITFLAAPDFAIAQALHLIGPPLFDKYCTTCHKYTGAAKGTPDAYAIWKMTTESIYAAVTKGPAHASLTGPTDDEKRFIAEYLGGRVGIGAQSPDAKLMPNQCQSNPPINDLTSSPSWNGWGNDPTNARFQSAENAGLYSTDVPNLKLKWAFGFPGTRQMYGQPTIAAGRVFIGVDSGAVYSIDAATGCVHWSFQSEAGVRNAISIGPIKGQGPAKFALYFGDLRGNVYAVDAQNGKQLWKIRADEHPAARITGAPSLYQDRLYVPVSSSEERDGGLELAYPCCTFRGSVVALNADTGRQIWKTYTITEAPKPTKKTSKGLQLWGPAGGAVWNSPTLDPSHRALYVGTGGSYTSPVPKTTDGIMAFDMDTGKILWAMQDTSGDSYLSGCGNADSKPENCPDEEGPDFDFGASPILRTLPNGNRVLVAGQKSGTVWAHDPDHEGVLVWKYQMGDKPTFGMFVWGAAADSRSAYFGMRTGGVTALDWTTGKPRWIAQTEPAGPGLPRSMASALSAIPGAIFSGGSDGMLRALSTEDGKPLWQFNMLQDFQTVNGVPAKGGAMSAPGPVIAGGMVFAGSGYYTGTKNSSGNVLLAFSAK